MFKAKFCHVHTPDIRVFRELLNKSVLAGQMSNFGPLYNEFAIQLAAFLGVPEDKEVIPVSSGHTALMAACAVLDSQSVVIPAYTFASTLQAPIMCAAKAEIVDVDLKTASITPEILENKKGKFDTVIAVTPLSMIPNLKDIQLWCEANNKKLIIDGAASFGAEDVINYGDVYCLSFHATKSFPIGEGGAVIVKKELALKVKTYINFGLDENKDVVMPGLNAKLSEYSCAIGLTLLSQISVDLSRRKNNAELYFRNIKPEYIKANKFTRAVYQSFPIYLDNALQARQALLDVGYEVKQYYKPLAQKTNTLKLFENNICLPCHPNVQEEHIKEMASIINAF